MTPSHNVKEISTGSYRFSGYQLPKDRNGNIIITNHKVYQPEYWKTRAVVKNEGFQTYESLRKN